MIYMLRELAPYAEVFIVSTILGFLIWAALRRLNKWIRFGDYRFPFHRRDRISFSFTCISRFSQ